MSATDIKIAFLEAGHFHANIFAAVLKGMKHPVTAISGVDADHRLVEEGCRVYDSYGDLLDNESVDFAFSFGMHNQMADILESLIERDIPFCTEKPVDGKGSRVAELARMAADKGLFTDVALPLRFSPFTAAIEKYRRNHDIGDIVHCYFRNMAGPIRRYVDWDNAWMLEKATALGGPFMNEGAHYIDLFGVLSGEDVSAVYAAMNNAIYGKTIEDNFSAILTTGTGKRCVIEICYGFPTSRNWRDLAMVVNTTKYLFTLIDREEPCEFKLEVRSRADDSVEIIDLSTCEQNVYKTYTENMLERFMSRKRGVVPLDEFCGTADVLEAAYASAETGRAVLLNGKE